MRFGAVEVIRDDDGYEAGSAENIDYSMFSGKRGHNPTAGAPAMQAAGVDYAALST